MRTEIYPLYTLSWPWNKIWIINFFPWVFDSIFLLVSCIWFIKKTRILSNLNGKLFISIIFILILKYRLGIFTVCFSFLFSLSKFEKQTYFRKPRGEVSLINSSIEILRSNFKSIVNLDSISLMFETLILKSQMKSG